MMFGANISLFAILLANSFAKAVSQNDRLYNTGMTKYRKGPQRTAKEHYTGPQRIDNHERTARLATILFNLKKNYLFIFL